MQQKSESEKKLMESENEKKLMELENEKKLMLMESENEKKQKLMESENENKVLKMKFELENKLVQQKSESDRQQRLSRAFKSKQLSAVVQRLVACMSARFVNLFVLLFSRHLPHQFFFVLCCHADKLSRPF